MLRKRLVDLSKRKNGEISQGRTVKRLCCNHEARLLKMACAVLNRKARRRCGATLAVTSVASTLA